MAFTVEDGTGVEDANAYVTIAEVLEYLTDRNRASEWTGSDAVKQAAVIAATDYVEKRWGRAFLGRIGYATQGLSWPRTYAYNGVAVTNVPRALKQAVSEYAARALNNPLWADPPAALEVDGVEVSGAIKRKREKVGPLEEEIEYSEVDAEFALSNLMYPSYPAADNLIYSLLRPTNVLER